MCVYVYGETKRIYLHFHSVFTVIKSYYRCGKVIRFIFLLILCAMKPDGKYNILGSDKSIKNNNFMNF